jgi:hypothetical protein
LELGDHDPFKEATKRLARGASLFVVFQRGCKRRGLLPEDLGHVWVQSWERRHG